MKFPNLTKSSKKRLSGWLKEDSPEVEGYIYKTNDGEFKLVKTKVVLEKGKLRTNAWATFHTHTMDCEEPEINCGYSPPSSTDVISFYEMTKMGLSRHVVFGIHESWIVECDDCGSADRHIHKVKQLQSRMKPGKRYQRVWKAIMTHCKKCKVWEFVTDKYIGNDKK